jgi:hypothetical protein
MNHKVISDKLAAANTKHGKPFKTDQLSPRTGKKSDLLQKLERLSLVAKGREKNSEVTMLQDYKIAVPKRAGP